jgi:SAM-dependent methyltransferase
MSDDRLKREIEFHNDRFGHDEDVRQDADKYYAITENAKSYFRKVAGNYCRGKRLLEYGCGAGGQTGQWVNLGATVTGIDISEEGVKKAQQFAADRGFDATYHVRNAEDTGFDANSFDVIVGTAILHHLDLNKSFSELARLLSADGHGIFIEPLGHNPLINLYRRLTPAMRTPDEHPLTVSDIRIAESYFARVNTKCFGLFSLGAVPFRNTPLFGPVYGALEAIDQGLMSLFPFLRKYAWMVVLDLGSPKKDQAQGR